MADDVLPASSSTKGASTTNRNSSAQLADLIAQATLKYSLKDYNEAAELYSHATELQAEINGEMSPQNADLLYAYGRCLYHLAVKKSDVLGPKVAGENRRKGSKISDAESQSNPKPIQEEKLEGKQIAREIVTKVVGEKEGPVEPKNEAGEAKKPYFQFSGDENWDTDEEEDEQEQDGGAADDEDDFANAYEVLDMARVLLQKKIREAEDYGGKSKEARESQDVQQLKERLADTYDLQAEISLEGEKFVAAVVDLKSALDLKKSLFSRESSLLAEAHYKLSLALEFSSVTQQKDENGEVVKGKEAHVDEGTREEAAQEMEAAIASCKLRIAKEEAKMNNASETNGNTVKGPKIAKKDIDDVKEIVQDMEQRLVELRQPPVSINDPTGTGTIDGSNPLSGVLGSIFGEPPTAQKARLEEAASGANDLTSLIKKKKPAMSQGSKTLAANTPQTNSKRKAHEDAQADAAGSGKKARVEDRTEDQGRSLQ